MHTHTRTHSDDEVREEAVPVAHAGAGAGDASSVGGGREEDGEREASAPMAQELEEKTEDTEVRQDAGGGEELVSEGGADREVRDSGGSGRTGGSGSDAGGRGAEFALEAGRKRVALGDGDEDEVASLLVGAEDGAAHSSEEDGAGDEDAYAPGVDDSADVSGAGGACLQAGCVEEAGEVEEDLVQPPRCDSPEMIATAAGSRGRGSSARRQRKASAISAAEQSLDSASALVAPDASLSVFSRGGRPGTSGRAPARALFVLKGVAEEHAGAGEGVEATGVRDSVGSGVHSVGEMLALPAGARGLGTPNSLRRAAAFAESLFEDSFDNGDVFASADAEERGKGVPVDKSLSGASFLVSMQKAARAAGVGEGAGSKAAALGGHEGLGGGSRRRDAQDAVVARRSV